MLPAIIAGAGLLSSLLNRGSKGAATERGNQNDFQLNQNQQKLSSYGTQQSALLQALLAQDRGALDRYGTQQAATTNALNSGSQEATSRYNTRQGATQTSLGQQSNEGLQRAQLGLQAPTVRARQSIMGSLMKNLKPVSIEGPASQAGRKPVISGGLTPAALDGTTRQHGDALMQAALMAQLNGSDVPAATDFKSGVLDAPAATNFQSGILDAPASVDYSKGLLEAPDLGGYKNAGKMESILGASGTITGILGEILKLIPNKGSSVGLSQQIGSP